MPAPTPEQQQQAIRELAASPGWALVRDYLRQHRDAIVVQMDDPRVPDGALRKLVGELVAHERLLEAPQMMMDVLISQQPSSPPDAPEEDLVSRAHQTEIL